MQKEYSQTIGYILARGMKVAFGQFYAKDGRARLVEGGAHAMRA